MTEAAQAVDLPRRDDDRWLADFAKDLAAISLSSDDVPMLDSAAMACFEPERHGHAKHRSDPVL